MNKKQSIYLKIIQEAERIIWQHKFLWWFGFFLSLSIKDFNFIFNNFQTEKKIKPEIFFSYLKELWEKHPEWLIKILSITILLGIILSIVKILNQVGIIESLNNIQKNKPTGLIECWRAGKKYFWKILTLDLFFFFLVLTLAVILFSPPLFLFFLQSYGSTFFVGLLAFFIFLPALIILLFVKKYAYFYLILGKLRLVSSLENGYLLFRKNWISGLLMGATLFSVEIFVSTILVFLIIFIMSLNFFLSLNYFPNIELLIIMFIAIFLRAILKTFFQTSWFLFFYQISRSKKEKEGIVEEESPEKKIIEAESV